MELIFLKSVALCILLIFQDTNCSIFSTNDDVQTFEKYQYYESMRNARAFLDLNNEIKHNGVLFAITVYLMTTGPVEFALWKLTADAVYELKYKYNLPVDNSMLFKRQEFYLPNGECFRVFPGYKVGFILPANSAPIGYRFKQMNASLIQSNTNEGLPVGALVQMDNLKIPYSFAISAAYDTKLLDPTDSSITTMNCPSGAKVLPDNSVLIKCNTSATTLLQECPVNITYIPGPIGPIGPPGLQGESGPPSPAALSTESLAVNKNFIGILVWLSILTLIQFIVIMSLILRKKNDFSSASTTPFVASTIDSEPGPGPGPGRDTYPNFKIAPAYNSHHSWVGKSPEDNWTLYKTNDNSSASCISGESC